MDTDQDSRFSLRDIFNLDYDTALELNKKIEKHVQELGQSMLGQIENLKKVISNKIFNFKKLIFFLVFYSIKKFSRSTWHDRQNYDNA